MRRALEDGGVQNPGALFPQGLDTYIGRMFDESGTELSEGQHQKIALARAFFAYPYLSRSRQNSMPLL